MNVGAVPIVGGTGALGLGLALRFASAGTRVVIGSRVPDRAAAAAEQVRERVPRAEVDGAANTDAVAGAKIILLCVPFAAQTANLTALGDALEPGQVVVDATVPLATAVGGRPSRLLGIPQGSAAAQARELLPDGVHLVSALHTVSAPKLADLGSALSEDVPVAGDSPEAKRAVAQLVGRIPGLRPVDCGSLEVARLVEGLTPFLISVNSRNKTHAGIRLAGLEEPRW